MELLRQLRARGNIVPVVILTAHGSIPEAVEAMKLGAIDFLTKPITPDALRRVVAEVIERHAVPPRRQARPAAAPRALGSHPGKSRSSSRGPSGPSIAASSARRKPAPRGDRSESGLDRGPRAARSAADLQGTGSTRVVPHPPRVVPQWDRLAAETVTDEMQDELMMSLARSPSACLFRTVLLLVAACDHF